MTDQNPIQVAVDAIVNCGPREDSTRIGSAGTVRRQAVDVSPLRRVNQAIALLTIGAREAAFRNVKSIAECLADELINAAKGSSNSYAIKVRAMPPVNRHKLTFHRLTEKGRARACCQVQPVKPPARVFGDLHSSAWLLWAFWILLFSTSSSILPSCC